MARPIKDNADYFSHDASMRDDPKIKALRRKFKHEGYSIWNMVLESITDADNFRFMIDFEIMGGDYDLEPEKLKEIVMYCVSLGLLQYEAGTSIVWSKTLDNRMSGLLSKRKRNRNPADGELSTSVNPQSKVKESKVFIEIGERSTKYIIIKTIYAGQRPKKVYNLNRYFEESGQLEGLTVKGWIHFEAFMESNSAKIFNDDGHLDNTFRNFCKEYKPPPLPPDKYKIAAFDKTLWTLEVWEKAYSLELKNDLEFRNHFGYNGKLSSS